MRTFAQKKVAQQTTVDDHALQRLLQSNAERLHAELATPASTRFGHDFSRIPIFTPSRIQVLPKLTVSAPGDVYEQEADRVADYVMRIPSEETASLCASDGGSPDSEATQPVQEDGHLQTNHAKAGDATETAVRLGSAGAPSRDSRPLDREVRAFMEPRFGGDFGRVRAI
jgi:hypothetical protein